MTGPSPFDEGYIAPEPQPRAGDGAMSGLSPSEAIAATIAQMEPTTAELGKVTHSLGEAATVSIAISLKRIADQLTPSAGEDRTDPDKPMRLADLIDVIAVWSYRQ